MSLVSLEKDYQIVRLACGVNSVRSLARGETFHPVIGPVAEAEALYVRQLKLRERLASHQGEFVIWDVGLGAAANVLTVLRATADLPCSLRIISFDNTDEPLRFALDHGEALSYLGGFEPLVGDLLSEKSVQSSNGLQRISWTFHLGDFPDLLMNATDSQFCRQDAGSTLAPHAIMFDAFSPAKNPEMWTLPLFRRVFGLLDAGRPCALPTYSRSTLLRVTLLLAGFFVGIGHATGEKEETTIAANTMDLIDEPLGRHWLQRARRSTSAEPLHEPVYRQAPLSAACLEALERHPQFAG